MCRCAAAIACRFSSVMKTAHTFTNHSMHGPSFRCGTHCFMWKCILYRTIQFRSHSLARTIWIFDKHFDVHFSFLLCYAFVCSDTVSSSSTSLLLLSSVVVAFQYIHLTPLLCSIFPKCTIISASVPRFKIDECVQKSVNRIQFFIFEWK